MSGQPFRARFGFDADGQKLIDLADPVIDTDGVNLQTLKREARIHLVARVGNLPNPSDPDPLQRPVDGRAYLIKLDLNGTPQDRIAVWDASAPATGGVLTVAVQEPAADRAAIIAAAGTSDAGKPLVCSTGTGAGAVLDLTANPDGTIGAQVTTPGVGYAIGETMIVPAASLSWGGMTGDTTITVTALTGAAPNGGWRFVDPQVWVNARQTDPLPPLGAQVGDLTAVVEKDKESLKVWSGSEWHTLVDTEEIKGWISSLALFQGTVQEVGGAVIGALKLNELPDVTVATTGVKHVGQYWVWTGAAGYAIQATDPNGVGADLAGAVMQVGDWLQVSAKTAADGSVSYHWSHIGGDLLARSRADVLYGLNTWAAGNYEKGSLVVYQGNLYRATSAVTPADTAPGTLGTVAGPGGVPPAITAAPWSLVPLNAGVKNVASDSDLPATAPGGDVYLVLNSTIAGGKPGLFSYDTAAARWVQLGGASGTPLDLSGGDTLVSVGVPIGALMMWWVDTPPPGWLICNGDTIDAALYPELRALIGTRVPDLRGVFIRGAGLNGGGGGSWGDASRAVGTWQEDSTARPKNAFITNATGNHSHSNGIRYDSNEWKGGGDPGGGYTVHEGSTGANGNHAHSIESGGDAETRPKNFACHYIMKATDRAVRRRT